MDRIMVLYGSNLGDANAHSTTNMPMLLAGGGFRHVGHLAFDRNQNYPLPNLFVSMLQQMGIEAGKFASSTGAMSGLEMTKGMIRAATTRLLLLFGRGGLCLVRRTGRRGFRKGGHPPASTVRPTASRDGKKKEWFSLWPTNPSRRKARAC